MNINVGSWDRLARIILGAILIALTLLGKIGAWGWIGLVPMLTGIFRFCPAYAIFGINSCAVKSNG